MQINALTEDYGVAGQIVPEDVAALAAAGYRALICNRPDGEVTGEETSDGLRAAAKEAGLSFTYNPVESGAMTPENIALQGKVVAETSGPVFAYCRSGMRSSVVWAFAQAGSVPVDTLIAAAAGAGYALDGLRAQLEAQANR